MKMFLVTRSNVNVLLYKFSFCTALQTVAKEGQFKIVKKLLAVGSDVNLFYSRFWDCKALESATKKKNLKIVKKLWPQDLTLMLCLLKKIVR